MSKIAIMIPCLNEAGSIKNVIKQCRRELRAADIYVYDNGSTDMTVSEALEAGAIIRHVTKRGKGHVIRQIFEDSNYECTIIIDGDDTYDITCLKSLSDAILSGYEMAVADRLSLDYYHTTQLFAHKAGNYCLNALMSILFHQDIKDALSGCRAFSLHFMKACHPQSSGFTIETELTLYAIFHAITIKWIPSHYYERKTGQSKINTFIDGFKIIWMMMTFYLFKYYEANL